MSATQIFLYILMILGFMGMLWANRQFKARGVPWGRPLAALCGIFSLLMAFISIVWHSFGGGDAGNTEEIITREMRYQKVAYKFLGREIAKRHPNAKILLIRHAEDTTSKMTAAKLDSLREGLGGQGSIASEEFVHSETDEYPEMMGPEGGPPGMIERELLTAEVMDRVIKENPHCNLVLSLVGLPTDKWKMEFWRMKPEKRPPLVLANAYIYEKKVKQAIQAGFITIVLHTKPVGFNYEEEPPKEDQAAFDKRFILITPENVDEMSQKYDRLFAPD